MQTAIASWVWENNNNNSEGRVTEGVNGKPSPTQMTSGRWLQRMRNDGQAGSQSG